MLVITTFFSYNWTSYKMINSYPQVNAHKLSLRNFCVWNAHPHYVRKLPVPRFIQWRPHDCKNSRCHSLHCATKTFTSFFSNSLGRFFSSEVLVFISLLISGCLVGSLQEWTTRHDPFSFLTCLLCERWVNLHDTSMRQRKNLSLREESNPWPPEHPAGALSTELEYEGPADVLHYLYLYLHHLKILSKLKLPFIQITWACRLTWFRFRASI